MIDYTKKGTELAIVCWRQHVHELSSFLCGDVSTIFVDDGPQVFNIFTHETAFPPFQSKSMVRQSLESFIQIL